MKSACLVQVETRLQIWLWKDGMLGMCASGAAISMLGAGGGKAPDLAMEGWHLGMCVSGGEVSMLGAGAGRPASLPQPHVL